MFSGFPTKDFPHKPPGVTERRVHSPPPIFRNRNALRWPLVYLELIQNIFVRTDS
jgi:hypothetical protein